MDASWRDDSDDADGQEIEADEVRSIVAALPEDHRGAFERFADVIEEIDTDPTKMPSDEDLELVDEVTAAVDELAPWAAEECGHDGPLWACLERSAFEPIGYAISDGPPPTLPDGQPVPSHLTMGDPDGILGEDWDLEIHRSDLVVAVAKVDDDGRVTSRQTVESSADHPGAWTQPTTTSCYDDDEMKFEPIPMPVGDEGDDQGYGFEDGGEQGIDYIGDSVADSTDDGG